MKDYVDSWATMKSDDKEYKKLVDWIKTLDEKELAKVKNIINNPEKLRKRERWNLMEERMYGKMVKDFGVFKTDLFHERNVFLTEKDNKFEIVIKSIYIGDFKSEPDYKFFSIDEAQKLRDIFDDAIKIATRNPLKKKTT
ncbi:hypothetical protein AYK25_00535 [Thermoplasmatales archaeon SM1-50]|nr:MAG: hypothetical protein AYK25_00535 [Thermoplasmatales archaeon SM1-50]